MHNAGVCALPIARTQPVHFSHALTECSPDKAAARCTCASAGLPRASFQRRRRAARSPTTPDKAACSHMQVCESVGWGVTMESSSAACPRRVRVPWKSIEPKPIRISAAPQTCSTSQHFGLCPASRFHIKQLSVQGEYSRSRDNSGGVNIRIPGADKIPCRKTRRFWPRPPRSMLDWSSCWSSDSTFRPP